MGAPRGVRPRRGLVVTVTDASGRPVDANGLALWLTTAAPARARGHVAIAIVSDREMRRLNRTYRRVDATTDVLSFPAEESFTWLELGDLAISRPAARRQAREYGHPVREELRILALHGLLHLLGYDHETDHGDMKRLEERLRRRAGLPAGLIARSPQRTRRR
jgi:probable rRNA maturation factor